MEQITAFRLPLTAPYMFGASISTIWGQVPQKWAELSWDETYQVGILSMLLEQDSGFNKSLEKYSISNILESNSGCK